MARMIEKEHTVISEGRKKMDVKAVIFDFDGPINDSFREGLRRIKIICAIMDIPFNRNHRKELTRLWGAPGVELVQQTLGLEKTFAEEVFYPAWERYDLQNPIPLIPRTREVLYWLRRNNIICTILTSRQRKNITEIFDRLDLLRDFDVISAKFDTPHHKPDPCVFCHTLERLEELFGILKNQCIFVGDTPADIDAGVSAEIETLLVQTGPYLLKHADKLPLPLSNILNSIDDLPGWIEEHDERTEFIAYE